MPLSEAESPSYPKPLSKKQQDTYEYLRHHVRETGRWPTYEDICDHMGWASPNSVTQVFKSLIRKGWLEREGQGVYRFSVGRCPHCGQQLPAETEKS